MDKRLLRNRAFRYLAEYGPNIRTKFSNICGKTGQYDVPSELFQKRTSRSNRVLIPWKTVLLNDLSLEHLNAFEGGVAVEFVNEDFFNPDYLDNNLYLALRERLGSNDNVSSIISIRSEGGNSSSSAQRAAFEKLTNNACIRYNGSDLVITKLNYQDYAIKQLVGSGKGNDKWTGFLFVSIRGGQQDTIETHHGKELTIFNPACEYASADVCCDIDLVMSYFAVKAIDPPSISDDNFTAYKLLIKNLEEALSLIEYDSPSYSGNLLEYCQKHYSLSLYPNQLTDPIQLKRICIENFDQAKRDENSIDFTHDEAVLTDKFYWDNKKRTILSPARPTNIFWSFHLSNMIQQNYSLDDYFKYEEERSNKRKDLIKNRAE